MRLSRRVSIAAAVAGAAALVAAALTIGGRDPATVVAASTSSSTTTSTTAAPATTSTTSSSTSTSPAASASTSAPPPTTTTTSLPRTLELRAEEGTITIEVAVEPAYPRAGELVRFHIEATDSDGGIMAMGFDAGDRRLRTRPSAPAVACALDPDAPRDEPPPTVQHGSYDYIYRVAAEHHFTVMAATGSCSREPHYAELEGTITVLAGQTTSNGPRPPEGSVAENLEGAPANGVRMSVGAWDDDGVVRRVHVDWGDGSEPSVLDVAEGDHTCVDEPNAYPTSGDTHTLDHVYATAGTYTVTATIVSTGCDGQAAQSVTVTGAATPKPQHG